MIPDFNIGPHEYPPHDILGSAEALGWEMWLEQNAPNEPHQFSLRMETEDSFDEIAKNQMHDLSPWLARFVTRICKIDARPSPGQP